MWKDTIIRWISNPHPIRAILTTVFVLAGLNSCLNLIPRIEPWIILALNSIGAILWNWIRCKWLGQNETKPNVAIPNHVTTLTPFRQEQLTKSQRIGIIHILHNQHSINNIFSEFRKYQFNSI